MARVDKKMCYRPVPNDANLVPSIDGKTYAVWKVKREEKTAEYVETKNGPRILQESEYYIAFYRDGDGRYRERSTGCRDRRAAEHKLSLWLQENDKIKAGIITQDEVDVQQRKNELIDDVLDDFIEYQKTISKPTQIKMHRSYIPKVCNACGFKRMKDLNAAALILWLNKQKDKGMGARTRNSYREPMVTFAKWAVRAKRLTKNPFEDVPKANEEVDRRHERRALSLEEIDKLLEFAERRPLLDATLVHRGKNKGKHVANIREEVREKLRRLGIERKMIYATLIYTGLRKNELTSLTVGQVFLNDKIPHFVLFARDGKSKKGAKLPIHANLLPYLREWLDLKGHTLPEEKLFRVPSGLSRILNRDLDAAGIEKRDILDQVVDVHGLRHTHGTVLAQMGVSPAIVQKSMRHAKVQTTLKYYTHLQLNDIAGGVNQFPDIMKKTNENENTRLCLKI